MTGRSWSALGWSVLVLAHAALPSAGAQQSDAPAAQPPNDARPADLPERDWVTVAAQHCGAVPEEAARSHALYQLAYVQARAGRLDDAKSSALKVNKASARTAVLAFIAGRQREAGNLDAARATLAIAKQRALADATEDSVSFGHWQLIRGLVDAGQVDEAQALVHALPSRFAPTIEIGVLAEQLSKRGEIDRALAAIRTMDQRQWPGALSKVAGANSSAACEAACLSLAEDLREQALRDRAFESLAGKFAAQGKFELANRVADRIVADPMRLRALGQIQGHWADKQSVEALAARVAEVSSREEKLPLLSALLKGLVAAGRIEEADQVIEQMAAVIRESPRESQDSKFGRSDDAIGLLATEANYLLTAGALHARGDKAAARERIERARDAILALPPESGLTKIMLVEMLATAQVGVGDLDAAAAMVRSLEPPFRFAAARVAVAYAEAGDAASAFEMARLMEGDATGRRLRLGTIAAAMIKAGDLPRAKELLASLADTNDDADGFRAAGAALIESGRADELSQWLDEMRFEIHRAYACLGAADVMNKSIRSHE